MPLTTYTFAQLQALFATQYSAAATIPANTDPGSTLGAIGNADALLALNVQAEALYVQAIARLSTTPDNADGTPSVDAINFAAPFGVAPIGAGAASGQVTYTLPSVTGTQIVVPVGGIFSTPSGLQFTVVAGGPGYNAGLAGYVIAIGQQSCTPTVSCAVAGSIGNVAVGQITQVYGGGIVGNGTVTNAAAFTSGVNSELGPAFKARFTLTVSGFRSASQNAVAAAILGVQAGLVYSIGDRLNAVGAATPATVTIVVNQPGGGTPPGSLLTAVLAAVNAVRAAGIVVNVIAPALVTVNATATVLVPIGTNTTTLGAAIAAAYAAFVNGVGLSPIGNPTRLSYVKTAAALLGVPGVSDIDNLALNGDDVDINASFAQQIVAGSFTPTWQFV